MTFKNYEIRLGLRIILLSLNIALLFYLVHIGQQGYLYLPVALLLWQVYELFRNQKRVYRELTEFSEAVYYRDFSRHFNVQRSPAELQPLRNSFNVITDTFKTISREKETHYHYLQHILEVVGTGILSFEIESGDIAWMNDALKRMLNLPHFKNVHAIARRNAEFYTELQGISIGDTKVYAATVNKQSVKFLLSATMFQIEGRHYKLLSLQDVNEALDETEANAWTKLLGVMTHEIMNSIAPISSLANTLKSRLQYSLEHHEPQPSYREDLEIGIDTIRKRSEALLKFADTYRNLNRINSLVLKDIYVRDIFENQHSLMMPTLSDRDIELEIVLKDPNIKVYADQNLVEQVLINLILNAMEAIKQSAHPKITLSAAADQQNRCILKVTDNGHGIPAELLDQIFIPFFSTKKNGTGVGLNLCKQIMLLHRGNIHVQTISGAGTSFIMTFNAP
ncbi:ATP-binding protein [Flavihumibacter sp. R14]|nr:ATP-binding protein [Flavihumibacter soli]